MNNSFMKVISWMNPSTASPDFGCRKTIHHLPFCQAIKLPILLYKPKFITLKGRIIIKGKIRPGMVWLGFNAIHIYPHSGITLELLGGELIFHGTTFFGNNSYLSIGEKARLNIGENVICYTSLKIFCRHHITIQRTVRIGWDVMIMDSSQHRLKNIEGTFINKGYSSIVVGHNTWLSTKCILLSGTHIAPYSVVAANSLINKSFDEPYVLLAGSPATVKKRGCYRDIFDDIVHYEWPDTPEEKADLFFEQR